MKSIYEEINDFLNEGPDASGVIYRPDANDLVRFSQIMIELHPSEKTFIQDWCLGIFVSKFSETIFSDKVLASYSKVYILDTKELGARVMTRQ